MTGFFDIMKQPPVRPGEAYPPFTRVSLETCGGCTRSCWFCCHQPTRRGQMRDDVFKHIMEQLAGFTGVVQMFYLNEPLLDPYLMERVARLRYVAPRCTIHITSNGDLLKPGQVESLFTAGVNSLNFNAYDEAAHARLHDLMPYHHETTQCWKRVHGRILSLCREPDRLHTWSGAVDPGTRAATGRGRCARPMRHIVAAYDGRMPLCCAVDPNNTETLGNASRDSLLDVWNSPRTNDYRRLLQDGRREGACAGCIERTAFPHVVRRVT